MVGQKCHWNVVIKTYFWKYSCKCIELASDSGALFSSPPPTMSFLNLIESAGNIINTYSTATKTTSIYLFSMLPRKALSSNRHSCAREGHWKLLTPESGGCRWFRSAHPTTTQPSDDDHADVNGLICVADCLLYCVEWMIVWMDPRRRQVGVELNNSRRRFHVGNSSAWKESEARSKSFAITTVQVQKLPLGRKSTSNGHGVDGGDMREI